MTLGFVGPITEGIYDYVLPCFGLMIICFAQSLAYQMWIDSKEEDFPYPDSEYARSRWAAALRLLTGTITIGGVRRVIDNLGVEHDDPELPRIQQHNDKLINYVRFALLHTSNTGKVTMSFRMIIPLVLYGLSMVGESWLLLTRNYTPYICVYVVLQFLCSWGFSWIFVDTNKLTILDRKRAFSTKLAIHESCLLRVKPSTFPWRQLFLIILVLGFIIAIHTVSHPVYEELTYAMVSDFFYLHSVPIMIIEAGIPIVGIVGVVLLFLNYCASQKKPLDQKPEGLQDDTLSVKNDDDQYQDKAKSRVIYNFPKRVLIIFAVAVLKTLIPISIEFGTVMLKNNDWTGYWFLGSGLVSILLLMLSLHLFMGHFHDQFEFYLSVFVLGQWLDFLLSCIVFHAYSQLDLYITSTLQSMMTITVLLIIYFIIMGHIQDKATLKTPDDGGSVEYFNDESDNERDGSQKETLSANQCTRVLDDKPNDVLNLDVLMANATDQTRARPTTFKPAFRPFSPFSQV